MKPGRKKLDRKLLLKTAKGIVTNPIILGILAGILWSVLRIPQPEIMQKTVKNVAVLATPLGLMAMGASFEGKKALAKLRPSVLASYQTGGAGCCIPSPGCPAGLYEGAADRHTGHAGVSYNGELFCHGKKYGP